MAELDDLRARIDQLDSALIAIVAERLAVCRQVAAVKEGSDTPVIQPTRVRDVVITRRQQAIEAGIDPDFAEQLFRVLLTETHRIEVAGHRPDAAPEKPASTGEARSGLDTVATRVDHIVIAVDDFESAKASLHDRFGFHEVAMAGAAATGHLRAGGRRSHVGAGRGRRPRRASPPTSKRHGQGVQHVAVEVLNAGFARACLADAGTPLLTEVLVDSDGHEQFFAVSEPAAGIQLGFISRTGHRVGVGADNVLALFDAIRTTTS